MYDWDEQNLPGDLMGRFTLKLAKSPEAKKIWYDGQDEERDPVHSRFWTKLKNGPPGWLGAWKSRCTGPTTSGLAMVMREEKLLAREAAEVAEARVVADMAQAIEAETPASLAAHVAMKARNLKGRPPNTLEVCVARARDLSAGHRKEEVHDPSRS